MAIPKKFLIGGITTAGSIATAAVVVVNQQRTTSVTPNTLTKNSKDLNKEPSVNVVKKVTTEQWYQQKIDSKPNQKAVQTWLKNNQKEGAWKIKIKKNGSTNDFDSLNLFTNDDLDGLSDYLTQKKSFLESLSSEKLINFVFEKTDKVWKHVWIKENIDSWVDKTSSNKAILKLENFSFREEEIEKLYNFLKEQTSLFNDLTGATETNKKIVLLTIINNEWKRSKEEIKNWLTEQNGGNNKFEIEIQESSVKQTLENSKEENLVGLLDYLTKNKKELFEYKDPEEKQKVTLTLKKNESNWKIIHNQNTINNWIDNAFSKKVHLKLWKNYSEQELSSLRENEFEQLLSVLKIKKEEDLFKNNLENASEKNKKTIVFEKYGYLETENNWQWMHIKDAMKKLLEDMEWNIYESKIKIKKKDNSRVLIKDAIDDEITGLLKHLKEKEDDSDYERSFIGDLVLKKKDDSSNEWEKVESRDIQT